MNSANQAALLAAPRASDATRHSDAAEAAGGGIDPLSLLDQPQLESRLQALLARSRQQSVEATLALLQLTNFYEIRTWVGKAEANLLLADITLVLCRALPPTVTLSRCENYEFALLLSAECSSNAREITQRVQLAMQSAVSSTIPPQLQLQCGVGLARIGAGAQSVEVLFARARHSLIHSGNRDDDIDSGSLDGKALARQIPQALRRKQLQLNFQPLLSFKHPEQHCQEVRSHLQLGETTLCGQQLFESAVYNALGQPLDRAVIHLCDQLLSSTAQDCGQLIVNLSLNSLVSSKFTPWLRQFLERHPRLRNRLLLQISELDLLVAQHHLPTFSDALRALHVPLCVTHFGSTRDPLRYLRLLYVHMIKLDGTLLTRLKTDSLQLQALETLITALHEKGIRVAAGMIDEVALLPLLWQAGVDAVQGNGIQPSTASPQALLIERRELSEQN